MGPTRRWIPSGIATTTGYYWYLSLTFKQDASAVGCSLLRLVQSLFSPERGASFCRIEGAQSDV